MCDEVTPIATKTRFLILQHPQETKKPLSTARLASLALTGAVHRVGLSWPSLPKAFGAPATPSRWAVLYLGALKETAQRDVEASYQLLSKGAPIELGALEGIVLLDGNWKQSKTLWWRNPWLLKLHRLVLTPQAPSQYGALRKQPRKNCLSTLEAAAETLQVRGEEKQAAALKALLANFLGKVKGNSETA